jgi:hypothetical protein
MGPLHEYKWGPLQVVPSPFRLKSQQALPLPIPRFFLPAFRFFGTGDLLGYTVFGCASE